MENKGEKVKGTLIERYGKDYFREIGKKVEACLVL